MTHDAISVGNAHQYRVVSHFRVRHVLIVLPQLFNIKKALTDQL